MKFTRSIPAFLPSLIGSLLSLSTRPANAGENLWTTHGPSGPVQLLAASPKDPRTIYAAGGAIYKSADGGETWELSEPVAIDSQFTCLAVDPTEPDRAYAGRWSPPDIRQFLKSQDGGAHWEAQTLSETPYSTAIAVDEGTGTIYRGTTGFYQSPLLKSTNGGDAWIATTLDRTHTTYALLADSLNGTVLVGTNYSYSNAWYYYGIGGNVARTVDGGATWSLLDVDLGSAVVSLAKDSTGSAYYAGTQEGDLYRSLDRGVNWAALTTLPGTVAALAVDPADSSVLYAATPNRGVLRSADGGRHWWSFNSGMATRNVSSLTIDATGRVLHVGTDEGVFDLQISPLPQPGPCTEGPDHLCFFGSRFRVDLAAVDPFTKTAFAAHAVPGNSRSGYFTFPSLTGDAAFPEVVVKMVDATSLPGSGYWVFYAGMTSLLYTVRITDATTGLSREYSGEDSCGGADVFGFRPGASAEASMSTLTATATKQTASEPDLALLGGRFRVSLAARNPATEAAASGVAIPQDDRFGSFSLPEFTGDPGLPEVFTKMIDAGGGSFLFFYTGLTSLDYSVTVLDSVTGTERTYGRETTDPKRPCGGAKLLMFGK